MARQILLLTSDLDDQKSKINPLQLAKKCIKLLLINRHFLRCIVWNTSEVTCDDVNFAGEAMSDIYLKGWLQGLENDQQSTDIHYRSMDGDGNFNWRFVFEFDYLLAEQSVVVKRKEHFWSLDETTAKQPPLLTLQIWDNDKFTADDFIGQLSLDLNKMIKPAKTCDLCGLHQLPNIDEEKKSGKAGKDLFISLFKQKRLKGWWPCIMELPDNKREIAVIKQDCNFLKIFNQKNFN